MEPKREAGDRAFFCDLCDRGYASDYEPDLLEHEATHRRFRAAVRHLGFAPWSKKQRDQTYDSGVALLHDSQDLHGRITGAELVLESEFHLYLRRAIRSGQRSGFVTFGAFIAGSALESMFSPDIAAHLRKHFGPRTGGPGATTAPGWR